MKAIYILIGLVFVSFLSSFAQNIPTGIPFQGIAKDFNGNPVNERKIYIQTNLICETLNPEHSMAWLHKKLLEVNPEEKIEIIRNYNLLSIKCNT